jgi:hypothetical protein
LGKGIGGGFVIAPGELSALQAQKKGDKAYAVEVLVTLLG